MYMERMIGQIGKLGRKIDWVERQMERMIGSIGKLFVVLMIYGQLGRNVGGANDRIDR